MQILILPLINDNYEKTFSNYKLFVTFAKLILKI